MLWWLVGCQGKPENNTGSLTGDPAIANSPAIQGEGEPLPTPTLAPEAAVIFPPTPIVQPSATFAPGAGPPVAPTPETDAGDEAAAPTAEIQTGDPAAELLALSILDRPAPTGSVEELLVQGNAGLDNGDYATAIEVFRAVLAQDSRTTDQEAQAQLGLGIAYLREGLAAEALAALNPLREAGAQSYPEHLFFLGQTYQLLDEQQNAIEAYLAYLMAVPEAAAYVNTLIAESYSALGNAPEAIAAYEAALGGEAHRLKVIDIRRRLAALYVERGEFAAAVEQYDSIRDAAVTEATKGEMTYLAGQVELQAGNMEAAYERFQEGINSYPRAYESYLGLVELVEGGIAVDDYQRGVVDYYGGAYQPAVEALLRYLGQTFDDSAPVKGDAHLFLAWSYEALGDLDAALVELDEFILVDAAAATWELAEMRSRAGQTAEATEAYLSYLENYPEGEQAPAAAWNAAALTAQSGDAATAVERYLFLADNYPFVEDAPIALFRAGALAEQTGDRTRAIEIWLRAAQTYPQNEYGARSVVALLRLPEADSAPVSELPVLVEALTPTNYFALRAQDITDDNAAFTADMPLTVPADPNAGQVEAEQWLREQLTADGITIPDSHALSELPPEIRDDPRRVVGERLWKLGLYGEAKQELESLRESFAGDLLASYQLSLYFRDLGLYRSSIIAAASALSAAGVSIYEAPLFLGRLSFPGYYADLVMPLAEHYGYDPHLQFALVRQESLFESFATSTAVAQGLSQVIPDTGVYIAERLAWPDYENADLYGPVVGLVFGAYYLDLQLQTFDNHTQIALSAYNGGPGNAARWYEQAGDDLDLYLDIVDFPETRMYIMRIYEGFRAYEYLYSGE